MMTRKDEKELQEKYFRMQRAINLRQGMHASKATIKHKPSPTERLKLVERVRRFRPPKAIRGKSIAIKPDLLLEAPLVANKTTIEYPTPSWFRFNGKADISVIVPLFRSAEVIRDQIKSWDLFNSGLRVELIYVDDCCPVSSRDYVIKSWTDRRDEVKEPIGRIYYNAKNLGFGGSCNVGAYYATGDYIIFLNADTTVTPNWIKPMIRLFKPDVGVVGNLQIKSGGMWDGTIDGAGSEWIWRANSFVHIGRHCFHKNDLAKPFALTSAPAELLQVGEREMVTGCCVAFPRQLFLEIGGFNPNYRVGYWEDAEICLTLREKGYKIMYQPNSRIYHKLSHSNSGAHPYHSHNTSYFMNKWVASGRIDPLVKDRRGLPIPEVKNVLVKRQGAKGDVLLASGVLAALKKKYPNCNITFCTKCPDIVRNHPHINRIIESEQGLERTFQLYGNLDLAYEYRPYTPVMEAYCDVVGVKPSDCEFFLDTKAIKVPDQYIVLHADKTGGSWAGREWPFSRFDALAKKLIAKGENVVCIGSDKSFEITSTLDYRGATSIPELAYIIKNAKLFVGIDSLPFQICQAMNVPGVVFFGSINPKYRVFRDNIRPVVAEGLDCLGCHHRQLPPSTVINSCAKGNLACIDRVTVDDMWATVVDRL